MELYYIAPFETWLGNKDLFMESHFVFLDEQKQGSELVFICAKFHHKANEANWRTVEGVEPLPHPLDPNGVLLERHVELLKHHGVVAGHRTMDAAERAAKLHVLFRFTGI